MSQSVYSELSENLSRIILNLQFMYCWSAIVFFLQRNIQRLTARQLDAYKADTWIMSPPCQPYTRQGKKTSYLWTLIVPCLWCLWCCVFLPYSWKRLCVEFRAWIDATGVIIWNGDDKHIAEACHVLLILGTFLNNNSRVRFIALP